MLNNLEFLRIIGCISVIFYHMFNKTGLATSSLGITSYAKITEMTQHGYLAVDLFFILSGLFFALKLDLTKSLWGFLKKKLIRLYPVLLFVLLASYILSKIFPALYLNIYKGILTLFCLNGTSLFSMNASRMEANVFWYVSAMLWVFALFYYLLKNFDKKKVNLAIAIITYAAYSIWVSQICFQEIAFTKPIFQPQTLRALGGIGLGYFIAEWYKTNCNFIKIISLSFFQKLFVTAIEFMCTFFIINNLMLHNLKFKNLFIYILVFGLTVVLFICQKGFISTILNKINWHIISKYTYSIFMVHNTIIEITKQLFWKTHADWIIAHPILNIIYILGIIMAFGVACYYFIEKPASKYLKKKYL